VVHTVEYARVDLRLGKAAGKQKLINRPSQTPKVKAPARLAKVEVAGCPQGVHCPHFRRPAAASSSFVIRRWKIHSESRAPT
jgi:hypothetical protein